MISEKIENLIKSALEELDLPNSDFVVEHPADLSHGDYSSNIAMVVAKSLGNNPKELADKIVLKISENLPEEVEKVESVNPGFINFYLSKDFLINSILEISKSGKNFGKNKKLSGKKIIVEYTDPNPFKEFHIGHLMNNSIGESISRLIEWNGSEIKRFCYQGDVGLHVAKALWAKMKNKDLSWGEAYAFGSANYDENKEEIVDLNKKIYEKSDKEINSLYEIGKQESLDNFEKIYKKLGTKFDKYYFESETGKRGSEVVRENIGKVFEESEGAVVYKGEERDKSLHTRVFINKEGIPTYEAKELGLAKIKYEEYPYDTSIVITGNEVNDYFRVLLSAMNEIYPELAEKTKHISHGMLRLPTGKMSSRTGDVITAEEFLEKIQLSVKEKSPEIGDEAHEIIAVSAVKYTILKQSIGKDVIFDMEKATSLEGDSGPYLLYTTVRAKSVLEKAKEEDIKGSTEGSFDVGDLERVLYRFEEVVSRAGDELAPQLLVSFLTLIASLFNSFYSNNPIAVKDSKESSYRVLLTKAVKTVLENGIEILGMKVPERM